MRGQQTALNLVGQLQVSLDAQLFQSVLVQLGVIHGNRRLRSDTGQHVEIFLPETMPRIERIDLHGA